ncbi:MAG: PaaX family transcriptional regulator C-terminal domain-containing protein [Rhizobiaceae bacterium]
MGQIEELLKQINRRDKLRVWSLIITFFGDSVMHRGGVVSARTIGTLMAQLGVESGAVRTALSRLASDGWIVRERQGRNAFYRLSPTGDDPFQKAASRIYATTETVDSKEANWMVVITDPNDTDGMLWAEQLDGFFVSPHIVLFRNPTNKILQATKLEDCFVIEGKFSNLPNWVSRLAQPNKSKLAYQELVNNFHNVVPKTPLEALALRTLLIHQWRRELLRSPELPKELYESDWIGFSCRKVVAEVYKRILPLSEQWLDEHIGTTNGTVDDRFA